MTHKSENSSFELLDVFFWAVLRIRIRIRIRIHMFLGLLDPPIIKQKKKNLDFYYFVTFFYFLSLKIDVKVPSRSNMQKNFFLN